jgi:hypothetical protein
VTAGRTFYLGSVALALGVGALQMFHVRAGVLTNYGADIFGTGWLYAIFRQGKSLYPRRELSPELTSAFVFLGCAASEFGQLWRVVPGTFDPFDLVAYGVTVLACYLVDRRVAALA